jgi:hypothetical protein
MTCRVSVNREDVSVFSVELPTQVDDYCRVQINCDSTPRLNNLGDRSRPPNEEDLNLLLTTVTEKIPYVLLPTGVTLAEALSCVEYVRRLGFLQGSDNKDRVDNFSEAAIRETRVFRRITILQPQSEGESAHG